MFEPQPGHITSLEIGDEVISTAILSLPIKWAASWQNQQSGMCAQQRLRPAWASVQSDQSLRCPHEETLGP